MRDIVHGSRRLCGVPAVVLVVALAAALESCGGGGGTPSAAAASGASGAAGGGSGGGTGGASGPSNSSGAAPAPSGTGTGTAAAGPTAFDQFASLRASIAGLATAQQQAQLDQFIDAAAAGEEGFPLRKGTRAAFVVRGPVAPAVAGDWNAWSQTASPLQQIGATTVSYAEVDLGQPGLYEYKFVDAQGNWQADALNRKFSYNMGNSVVNLAGSGHSHLELLPAFPSNVLGNTRDVILYLPAGYLDDAPARYPVLYMHDGQNLFDPQAMWGGWDVAGTADGLIASGSMRKIIVVGAANTPARFDEYTHVQDDLSSNCNGSQIVGGQAALYGQFLVNELKPTIDGRWRTLPDRDNTAILGSSLGGLVSVWIGYAYPRVFKLVGGMSSTFEWGKICLQNPTMIDLVKQAGKQDFRIYIDTGGGPGTSTDNYDATDQMRQLLVSQGFQYGVDLMHWWEPNALHNEAAWRARLNKPLQFWFP
jgi:predicted alpha/beta superfamily hydrolase